MPANSFFLPHLYTAAFFLCPHVGFPLWERAEVGKEERKRKPASSLVLKGPTNAIKSGPNPYDLILTLITFLIQIRITLGVGISIYEFWRDTFSP